MTDENDKPERETTEEVTPEIVAHPAGEEPAADEPPTESRFARYMLGARYRINKFIEARAVKKGLDPGPVKAAVWELLLLLPRLLKLTVALLADGRVPLGLRLKCGLALAYVVSPFDLLSEAAFGPVGMLDDLAILLIVLDVLLNEVDPQIVRDHWRGSEDVLKMVSSSAGATRLFIPDSIYNKIIGFFRGKKS